MRKLSRFLFAVALATTAILSTTTARSASAAPDICTVCYEDPWACFACCRCGGGSFSYCRSICPD